MKIRLFIKPYCPWCHKAMHWLDEHGIKYETLDVIANEAAFDEMIRLSGQELAPVIEVDGKVLADFGPEQLAGFLEKTFQPRMNTDKHGLCPNANIDDLSVFIRVHPWLKYICERRLN